ncbi:MAG: family 16 glycoside hydrolase, partial [Prosthecobacter sp.]|nr:family 16 glycoside hydrolase [Prosthecobacter sp.]
VLEPMEWGKAAAKAMSMGGHLATINSRDEEEWVKRTFRPLVANNDSLLLGGQRKTLDGSWEWLTGEPFTYRDWGGGWPDDNSQGSMVLALHLPANHTGWDDIDHGKKAPFLVEWDEFGNTPPGLTPKEIVDLLAQVEVPRDAVKGRWKKVPTGIEVEKAAGPAMLEFNYEPPEEYDFIMEFTPKGEGSDVNQFLSAQDRSFAWKLDLGGNSGLYGFDLLDGKDLYGRKEAAAKVDKPLRTGQRYRSESQVRTDGLRALVDGEEVVNWRGDFKRLSLEDDFTLRNFRHLGVGSWGRSVAFHHAEVRVVTAGTSTPKETVAPVLASIGVPSKPEPMPAVTTSVVVIPGTPRDPRLAQLETGFQARFDSDVQKPYLAAVASLNQSYINSGIARARAAAQARGDPNEVAAFDAEKALIEGGGSLPATDAAGLPADLLQLRKTYRESLARHAVDRAAKAAPLYAIYVRALDVYVVELTKANRIDDAQRVKQLRDEIAEKGARQAEPGAAIAAAGGALTLFDGKSLEGWKSVGDSAAFTVADGMLKASGGKANLYYVGQGSQPPAWKDFDLTLKVKTGGKANSGLWIHAPAVASGSGSVALEVQIANGNADSEKTGSLWSVKAVREMIVKDDEWFDLRVTVKGMRVTIYINDKEVNDWTQPTQWEPPAKIPNARLGEGTIGLQSNGGQVWFKDIQIKVG